MAIRVNLQPDLPALDRRLSAIEAEQVTKSYLVGKASVDILHGV